jgi:flagellar hook-length control protein FliK
MTLNVLANLKAILSSKPAGAATMSADGASVADGAPDFATLLDQSSVAAKIAQPSFPVKAAMDATTPVLSPALPSDLEAAAALPSPNASVDAVAPALPLTRASAEAVEALAAHALPSGMATISPGAPATLRNGTDAMPSARPAQVQSAAETPAAVVMADPTVGVEVQVDEPVEARGKSSIPASSATITATAVPDIVPPEPVAVPVAQGKAPGKAAGADRAIPIPAPVAVSVAGADVTDADMARPDETREDGAGEDTDTVLVADAGLMMAPQPVVVASSAPMASVPPSPPAQASGQISGASSAPSLSMPVATVATVAPAAPSAGVEMVMAAAEAPQSADMLAAPFQAAIANAVPISKTAASRARVPVQTQAQAPQIQTAEARTAGARTTGASAMEAQTAQAVLPATGTEPSIAAVAALPEPAASAMGEATALLRFASQGGVDSKAGASVRPPDSLPAIDGIAARVVARADGPVRARTAASSDADPAAVPVSIASTPVSVQSAAAQTDATLAASTATPVAAHGAIPAPDLSASLGQRVIDMSVGGQWIDGLAKEIATLSAGSGQGTFHLSPPHLGPMRVDVRNGDLGAQVSLTVQTEAAEAALRQDSDKLKTDGQFSGIRISDVRIDRVHHVAEPSRSDTGNNQNNSRDGNANQANGQSMLSQGQSQSQGQNQAQTQAQANSQQTGRKTLLGEAVLSHAEPADQRVGDDSQSGFRRARYA